MAEIDRSKLQGPTPSVAGRHPALLQGFRGQPPSDSITALAAVLHDVPKDAIIRFEDWNQGFRSGMKVTHQTFGRGTIHRLNNRRGIASAHVMFDDGNLREVAYGSFERATAAEPAPIARSPSMAGARVEHPHYGKGTVYRVVTKKGVERMVVDFDEIGRKKLATHRHEFRVIGP